MNLCLILLKALDGIQRTKLKAKCIPSENAFCLSCCNFKAKFMLRNVGVVAILDKTLKIVLCVIMMTDND